MNGKLVMMLTLAVVMLAFGSQAGVSLNEAGGVFAATLYFPREKFQ